MLPSTSQGPGWGPGDSENGPVGTDELLRTRQTKPLPVQYLHTRVSMEGTTYQTKL